MHNNKITKILAVSLLAAFGITACDDIEARPNDKGNSDETQMISFKSIDSVYGNNYESLNDYYHDSVATKTLDEILYTYAVGIIAPFNATVANTYASKIEIGKKAVSASDFITLEDVHKNVKTVEEFVAQYKAYAVLNEDGTHNTAKEKEYIESRYAAIERKVAKAMYEKASATLEDNKFDERRFLVSLYSEGKKVTNPYTLTTGYTKDQLLLPDVEPENVFTANYLHKEFYSSATNTYVEDEIMPGLYRDMLVQQYIFDNQENLLGSSYARKISYVAIKYDGVDNSIYAEKLVKSFVKDYLLSEKGDDVLAAFKLLSRTWNGEFMNNVMPESKDEWKLLKTAGLVGNEPVEGEYIGKAGDKFYIKDTAYGDLVEDYAKYDINPAKSTSNTDYTGGNKYVKEIGFKLESEKITLNDHTTTGWFVKSSSEVSSLPEAIRNRLYNLSVATGKNGNTSATLTKDASGKWSDTETNKFITKFANKSGDRYFLRQSSRKVNAEAYEDIIFNDTASSTYYIISVDEAVSPNFMTTCQDYATRIAVAELLSSSDTNVTLAKKYWVEKCDISYHDQSVYDYFESQFPELFEDD